jgi:hypothetical protein
MCEYTAMIGKYYYYIKQETGTQRCFIETSSEGGRTFDRDFLPRCIM